MQIQDKNWSQDPHLQKLQEHLIGFGKIMGKQHADQVHLVTDVQYQLSYEDVVKNKVQQVIYEKFAQKKPVSSMAAAYQSKKDGAEEIKRIDAEKNIAEVSLHDLGDTPITKQRKSKSTLITWALCSGLAVLYTFEMYYIADAFIIQGSGIMLSLFIGAVICTLILVASHFLQAFVSKLAKLVVKIVVYCVSTAIVFWIFLFLAKVRVSGIAALAARDIEATTQVIQPPAYLVYLFATVSAAMFVLSIIASSYVKNLQSAKKTLEVQDKKIAESTKLQRIINTAEIKKGIIKKEVQLKKEIALEKFEDSNWYFKQLENIANMSHSAYVSTYVTFKAGEPIPSFLHQKPNWNFEHFFTKNETNHE